MGAPVRLSRDEQAEVGVSQAEATLAALGSHSVEETLPNVDVLVRETIGEVSMITPET